jgi:hypothetical protein
MKKIPETIAWMIAMVGALLAVAVSEILSRKKGKCNFCEEPGKLSLIHSDWEGHTGWACGSCRKRLCSSGGTYNPVGC